MRRKVIIDYAPVVIEHEILHQYNVKTIGRAEDLRMRFYAISAERELEHPGVDAITGHFRSLLSNGKQQIT